MFRDRDGWRVQWRVGAKRHSRKFDSKKEAQRFEAELKAGLLSKADREPVDLTFTEFADRWLREYCRREKAESQWFTDESAIRIHLLPMLGAERLRAITRVDIMACRERLRVSEHPKTRQPLRPKTVNLVLGTLKRMLAVAVDWELIPSSPGAGVPFVKVPEQAMQFWTAAERDRFLRFALQADPAFAELVLVAVHTGLRRGELAGLTVSQLDFERRLIRVDATYCFKAKERFGRTKTGRMGHVPMNAAVHEALADRRLAATTSPVFPLEVFSHAAQKLRKLSRRAGVRPLPFHGLRHTCASLLVMDGVPLYTVQRMLRHSTPLMTQRYAHLADDQLHEAASRLVARAPGTQSRAESESGSNVRQIAGAVGRI